VRVDATASVPLTAEQADLDRFLGGSALGWVVEGLDPAFLEQLVASRPSAGGPVAGLAVFYLWPRGTLLARVVRPGSIGDAFGAPGLGRVLWFTLWQAVVSTALTLVAGFAPAYVLARFRFPGRRALLALVTVPFMLPTVVVGAAFLALLPDSWHGTARAVVVAHVFFNIAVVVRLVGAMWAVLPTDLTAAARTLGASPPQVTQRDGWRWSSARAFLGPARGRANLRAWGLRVDSGFDNASAGVSPGREELGGTARLSVGPKTALFATALGLVAAIPAVIFYNKFTGDRL
jgi:hypothetical protein